MPLSKLNMRPKCTISFNYWREIGPVRGVQEIVKCPVSIGTACCDHTLLPQVPALQDLAFQKSPNSFEGSCSVPKLLGNSYALAMCPINRTWLGSSRHEVQQAGVATPVSLRPARPPVLAILQWETRSRRAAAWLTATLRHAVPAGPPAAAAAPGCAPRRSTWR